LDRRPLQFSTAVYTGMVMDGPIDQGGVKPNVPAFFFAQNPFVTEYFLSLRAKCLVKLQFREALGRSLRNNRCRGHDVLVELENKPSEKKPGLVARG
jgi:hypothetical protein